MEATAGAGKWVFGWDVLAEGNKVFVAAGDRKLALPLGVDGSDGVGGCDVDRAAE